MDSATIIAIVGLLTTAAAAIVGPFVQARYQAKSERERWVRERRVAELEQIKAATQEFLTETGVVSIHKPMTEKMIATHLAAYLKWEVSIWPFLSDDEKRNLHDGLEPWSGGDDSKFVHDVITPLLGSVRRTTEGVLQRYFDLSNFR